MSTISSASQTPIDVAIAMAYSQTEKDAIKDLNMVIDQIEANSKKKDQLRKLSQLLIEARNNVDSGLMPDMTALQDGITEAGYGPDSPLGLVMAKMPTGMPAAGQPLGTKGSPSQVDQMNDWLENIDSILKGELDRFSDIGSELQTKLNQKSSTYRRMQQGNSDNVKAFSQLLDTIIRNYAS